MTKDGSNHDGKEFVSMVCCQICNDDMYIIMKRNLRKTLQSRTIIPGEVCQKCKEKHLSTGILVTNPETGSLVVMSEDGFRKLVTSEEIVNSAMEKRVCFAEETIVQNLIHMHNEMKGDEPSGTTVQQETLPSDK